MKLRLLFTAIGISCLTYGQTETEMLNHSNEIWNKVNGDMKKEAAESDDPMKKIIIGTISTGGTGTIKTVDNEIKTESKNEKPSTSEIPLTSLNIDNVLNSVSHAKKLIKSIGIGKNKKKISEKEVPFTEKKSRLFKKK